MKFTNRVIISGVDAAGRPRQQIAFNGLTFAAADNMVAALLQSRPARVTHLYGIFSVSNSVRPLGVSGDIRAVGRSDFMATDNSTYGGFFIPLVAAPSVESTDGTIYQGNTALYYFRIPGSISAGVNSGFSGPYAPGVYISGIGLGVAQNASDRSQDRIISVLGNGSFNPFAIASNGQETVEYPYQIVINQP